MYTTDRPIRSDRPYTVNFKCAFKYFPKIESRHGNGYCQSAALAIVAEIVSRSQTLAGRRVWSTAHIRLVPRAISAFTATAFTLCSYNSDVSSKRSLTHTRLARSNVNSVVRNYLSPTPSLIWAVDQTLLPARVWLHETTTINGRVFADHTKLYTAE